MSPVSLSTMTSAATPANFAAMELAMRIAPNSLLAGRISPGRRRGGAIGYDDVLHDVSGFGHERLQATGCTGERNVSGQL